MKEKATISTVEYVEANPIVYVKKSVWLNMIKKRNDLAKHNIELSQQRDFWKKKYVNYPKLNKKEIKELISVIDVWLGIRYSNQKTFLRIKNKLEKILKK